MVHPIRTENDHMLTYKGYTARIDVNIEDGVLHGRVLNTQDVITFEADRIEEVRQAFEDSVDDYLEFCQEIGQKPEKPFSGRILFRTTPALHRMIFLASEREEKSVNQWMEDALSRAALESTVRNPGLISTEF